MAAYVEPLIELELSGRGAGWTAITADVLTPMRISYGIRGGGPTDRTASSGSCTFILNNGPSNSAGVTGYYSPGGAVARTGFTLGIRMRVSFRDPNTSIWHVKFLGAIQSIAPVPGRSAVRTVQVVATDWIDEAARSRISGLTTQTNVRSDQVLDLLLANVPRAPEAEALATGSSTFAYALDTARDDKSNPVLQEIARVVASELGYFYVTGDGTATFEARGDRYSRTDDATFANTMSGLELITTRDSLVSKVQVVTHPRTVDATNVVLYSLQSVPSIPVGGTVSIFGGYTDPTNRASRVGGTSMVTPVASTDYTANSEANGTGTDLTANLTVATEFTGNGVRFTLTNTASVPLYVTKLQARGIGIYDYGATAAEAEDASIATDFGDNVVSIDMPYQSDVVVGTDSARSILALYGASEVGSWYLGTAGASELGQTTRLAFRMQTTVGSVRIAPQTLALQTQIMARDVGDRIALLEDVTGVASSFYIHAIDLDVRAPGIPFVTWTLAPANTTAYWRLGTTGFSELGASTRLAFS